MFRLTKMIVPSVLVTLASFAALANAQIAAPPKDAPATGAETAQGAPLSLDGLVAMLRGLGYEPEIVTTDNGYKYCNVKFQHDGWTFQFTVSLSSDNSVVWISAYLDTVPAEDKALPEPMRKILQLNGSGTGKAKFVIKSEKYLYVEMPIDNRGIKPLQLRAAIEGTARIVKATAADWKTGAWTAEGKKAAVFKGKIEALQRKVNAAGAEFAEAIKPVFGGGKVDREKLKAAHARLHKTLREVRAEAEALEVPNSPAARELVEVYLRMLEIEESFVQKEMEQVMQIAQDESLSTADRVARIKAIYDQLVKKEEAAAKALQTAHANFRNEYGNV